MRLKRLLFGDGHPILRDAVSLSIHLLCLIGLDLAFRIVYSHNDPHTVPSYVPFLLSLFWGTVIAGASVAMPRIVRRIWVIATTAFFGVIVIVHACLESFFGQYLSFSSVMFAGEGAGFFDWSYFDISGKLIAAVILAVIASVIAALILGKTKRYLIRLVVTALAVAVGLTGAFILSDKYFEGESGGITWESTKTAADHYDDFSDYHICLHMCGLYHYTYRDIYVSTGLIDAVELFTNRERLSELDEYYSSKTADPDNDMTGVLSGKNLILVQLESIDTWMVNETAMPTLYSLMQKGINFTEFYAPKYLWAATFNTENVVNTGTVSPMNSSKVGYFTDTAYPDSLPGLFRELGYSVNSFHRSGRGIYNRGEVHENWGYGKYYSGAEMGVSNADMDSTLTEAYSLFAPDGISFMSFIITYTGHGPYTADGEAVKKYESIIRAGVADDAEDEYVWALCHAYETDTFIKNLIEKLESDGKIENTAVIFYTDHYDHYLTGDGLLEKYKGTSDGNLMSKVPFVIYSKGLVPTTVDKVTASYDILPTVANLFGLDTDGKYYIGNDAFSSGGGYVIFSDRSWYDGQYYSAKDNVPGELLAERSREIDERLNICWDSVKFNYFKDK